MSKDLWIMEHEQAQEDFINDHDVDAFCAKMKSLGFDPHEIQDHIDALMEEVE